MIRLSEAIARANCVDLITPQIVREAYSLLRQSIIHVEQDDINFDDEEDDQVDGVIDPSSSSTRVVTSTSGVGETDESMDDADAAALDAAEASYQERTQESGRRKMRITCKSDASRVRMVLTKDNKYMEIMNLCVLHLSDIERETGNAVDKEELVQWYLEQKEYEFESEEELEYERQLVGKALDKLAKVSKEVVQVIIADE